MTQAATQMANAAQVRFLLCWLQAFWTHFSVLTLAGHDDDNGDAVHVHYAGAAGAMFCSFAMMMFQPWTFSLSNSGCSEGYDAWLDGAWHDDAWARAFC